MGYNYAFVAVIFCVPASIELGSNTMSSIWADCMITMLQKTIFLDVDGSLWQRLLIKVITMSKTNAISINDYFSMSGSKEKRAKDEIL